MKARIRVGLLGCGTVGGEVARRLTHDPRLASRYELAAVAVRDLARDRGPAVDAGLLSRDPVAIAGNPSVDVLVEVMGGTPHAHDAITTGLRRRAPAVSANKALFAQHGWDLEVLARTSGTAVRFGAAVGGAVPMLEAVARTARTDSVTRVEGVLNGTCNFVLNRMTETGCDLSAAIAEAQHAGYAEADPKRDLDGTDTAEKLVLLARAAWDRPVATADVDRTGITALTAADLRRARAAGRSWRLVGAATRDGCLVVEPRQVPDDHAFARLTGPQNALVITSEHGPPLTLTGDGAGAAPTAAAILADLDEVTRSRRLTVAGTTAA